ncbi:hypothetical protein [Streptomyces sp. NPDC001635]
MTDAELLLPIAWWMSGTVATGKGDGTADTVLKARSAGVPVDVVRSSGAAGVG